MAGYVGLTDPDGDYLPEPKYVGQRDAELREALYQAHLRDQHAAGEREIASMPGGVDPLPQPQMQAGDSTGPGGQLLKLILAANAKNAPAAAPAFDWDAHPEVTAQAAQPAAFDWSAHPEVAPAQPVADEPPGKLEAFLRGGAQGATLGFGDEINGFIDANLRKAGRQVDNLGHLIHGEPLENDPSLLALYQDSRDAFRRENQRAEDAHGGYYLGGNVAGGLVTAPLIPGGAAGKTATLGQRLLAAAKTGAAFGAANGLGSSNADVTQGQLGQAAADTAVGAGAGAVGGAALTAGGRLLSLLAQKPLQAASESLESAGLSQARRFLVGTSQSLSNKKTLSDDAVREALDSGAIGYGSTIKATAKRLDALREGLGDRYTQLVKDMSARGIDGPDAHALALNMLGEADKVQATTLGSPIPKLLRDHAEELVTKQTNPNGTLPLDLSEDLKRSLQQQARGEYNKLTAQMSPTGEAKVAAAALVKNGIEDAVDAQAAKAPELAAQFRPVKQQLGRTIEASNTANAAANRAAKNHAVSLRDMLSLSKGGPPGLALSYLARTRGTSAFARGAYDLSGLLGSAADALPEALPFVGGTVGRSAAQLEPAVPRNLLPSFAGEDDEDARNRAMLAALRNQ